MATEMTVDKPAPPKLDVDEYLTSALSVTPAGLHPYFTAFKDLHSRKYVNLAYSANYMADTINGTDYGTN